MAIIDQSADGKASPLGWQRIHTSRLYDRALRFSFAFWWMLLAVSHTRGAAALFLHDVAAGWSGQEAALLASRICLCLFLLLIAWVTLQRMQPVAKAKGVLPRLFAALGTYLIYGMVLLPMPHLATGWLVLSAALLLVGNAMSVAILTRLGGSFSIMPEARRLVTEGPYKMIRHPLYLAEQIAVVGAVIQFASPIAALIWAAQLLCQFRRMHDEETVLERAFPDYAAYRARTARFIPGIW